MNIEYKLFKERRKSLKLFIRDGEVIVKAPNFLCKNEIESFLKKHIDWIEKRLKEYQKNKKEFLEGEKFLFMGKEYPLVFKKKAKDKIFVKNDETADKLKKTDKEKILFDNAFIVNEKYKSKTKEILIEFYKKEAEKYILKRVEELAKKYNLKYNLVKISNAQKRWGSCSSKKNLNFSYRLIMAPKDVIDYVIIHELSHLRYFDHSKNFYKLVSKRCPNYKIYEKWLKENSLKTLF